MKTVEQFLAEGYEFNLLPVDKMWQGEEAYAKSKGYKFLAGSCGFSSSKMDLELYFLNLEDKEYVESALQNKLKTGDMLFRYTNSRIKAGGMMPLVKINPSRGLIYYNKPEAADEDVLDFESRGIKLRYVTLRDDYKTFMKMWMYAGKLPDGLKWADSKHRYS